MAARVAVAAVALALGASAGSADSYHLYDQRRFASADGRHVVIVRALPGGHSLEPGRTGPRGEFHWIERAETTGALAGVPFDGGPGDRSVRRGLLTELPPTVLVSSDGRGFVALESWGPFHRGVAATVVFEDRPAVELVLADLFDEEALAGLGHYPKRWLWTAWLLEDRLEAVVVGFQPALRAIDLATGEVRPMKAEAFEALLPRLPAADVWLALDVLRRLEHPVDEERLRALLAARETPAVRIRAAVLLAERGDDDAVAEVLRVARRTWEGDPPPDEVAFALASLPGIRKAAPAALDAYRAAARAHGAAADGPVLDGLRGLAKEDPLAVLSATGRAEPPSLRPLAVIALRQAAAVEAVPGLCALARDDPSLAALALHAASEILPYGVAPAAPDLLGRSPELDEAVLSVLTEVRWRPSAAALVARLAAAGERDRALIVEALRFQTGADAGADVAAWRRIVAAPPARPSAWRDRVRASEAPVRLPDPVGGPLRRTALATVLRARALLAEAVEEEEAGDAAAAAEHLEGMVFLLRASPVDLSATWRDERWELDALDAHRAALATPARTPR